MEASSRQRDLLAEFKKVHSHLQIALAMVKTFHQVDGGHCATAMLKGPWSGLHTGFDTELHTSVHMTRLRNHQNSEVSGNDTLMTVH